MLIFFVSLHSENKPEHNFMNLFVRYFDHETLVHNIDEVEAFLAGIDEIKLRKEDLKSILKYWDSNNQYPYRMRVSPSNYVLFLKTEADTVEGFKEEQLHKKEQKAVAAPMEEPEEPKKTFADYMNEEHRGWYEATMLFKRVVRIQGTNKCQYKDTVFRAQLKAESGADCYNRLVEHLRNRQDVDVRSQFPSIKSNNFEFEFLGDSPTVTA